MLRKSFIICAAIGMVLVLSLPVIAKVETTGLFTIDDTQWELQNGIITGVDSIGFSEDNIYVCNSDVIELCLPLPNSEYTDLFIVSFFSWEVSGDIIEIGIGGIVFPLVGIGFLITDDGDFSLLIKSDDDWTPSPF